MALKRSEFYGKIRDACWDMDHGYLNWVMEEMAQKTLKGVGYHHFAELYSDPIISYDIINPDIFEF